ALADIIYLQDGRKVGGIVLRESDELVILEAGSGRVELPRESVAKIERESEGMRQLRRAEFDLIHRRPVEAERRLYQAMDMGVTPYMVRLWCIQHQGKLERNLTDNKLAGLDGWAALTRELAGLEAGREIRELPDKVVVTEEYLGDPRDVFGSVPESPSPDPTPGNIRDFSLVMAPIFVGTVHQGLAAELLLSLDNASLRAWAKDDSFLRDSLVRRASRLLNRGRFREAWVLAARMDAIGMRAAEGVRVLTILRWASLARKAGLYQKALEVLETSLLPINRIIARERMVATVLDARKKLPETGRFDTLIGIYEKYGDELPGLNARHTMGALYRQWGQVLLDAGQPEAAKRAFEHFYQLRPGTDYHWIDRCDYAARAADLEDEDFAGRFRLGEWAAEKGLLSKAVEAYQAAAQHPKLEKLSLERVKILREQIGLEHLERCIAWLEQGDPEQALDEIKKFEFFPETWHMREDVNRLRESAAREVGRRAKIRAVQAESLLQDAERRFFLGEREDAMQQMRTVMEQYNGTPAADRATEFMPFARARVMLERFEGGDVAEGDSAMPERDSIDVELELKRLMRQLGWTEAPVREVVEREADVTTVTITAPENSPEPPVDLTAPEL
ncbi:MAG: hypothetical protein ACOC29_01895, partial [Candidatus Sumerlaeota bacterium]